MLRTLIGFALVSAFASGTSLAQPLEGCYIDKHPINYWNGKEQERIYVTDFLEIRRKADNTYTFEILVVGDNTHVCSGTAEAKVHRRGDWQYLEMLPEGSTGEREVPRYACDLKLSVDRREIRIAASKDCDDQFGCGVGIGVDGARFKRSNKLPDRPGPRCTERAP